MHTLSTPLAGLTAFLVIINQWLNAAPFDEALVSGLGIGLAVYLMLLVGDATVQALLARQKTRGLPHDAPRLTSPSMNS